MQKMYAITAIYVPKLSDGWESSGQGLPTFYLDPDVQGIFSESGAEAIARSMFAPFLKEGDEISISATEVYLQV